MKKYIVFFLLLFSFPCGAQNLIDAKKVEHIGVFDDAVTYAAGRAHAGDIVILSPAAASFDAFPNFERRGDRFCELVRAI